MVSVAARLQTTYMVYVNRVGCEEGLSFAGGSVVVDPFGAGCSEAVELAEEAEQLHDALVLGVRDYVTKCGFSSVCLGLSGGIDSASILAMMSRHSDEPVRTFLIGFGREEHRWDELAEIRRLAEARDWPGVDAAVHRLRGATAYCGVPALDTALHDLSLAAKSAAPERIVSAQAGVETQAVGPVRAGGLSRLPEPAAKPRRLRASIAQALPAAVRDRCL